MIYRDERRYVYHAGINYRCRLEDIGGVWGGNERGDAWKYYDIKGKDHLIYRGVDITVGICNSISVSLRNDHWEWCDGNDWIKEKYPHDL